MTMEVEDAGALVLPGSPGDERHAMRSIELELHVEFPWVPIDQVAILVECLWSHYDDAPVRDFVALLVRKQAREELSDHLDPRAEATVAPVGPRPPAPR